jgi:uncharacterized repeat protein (TIGR03803 family)
MRKVLLLLLVFGIALGNVANAQSYTESILYTFPTPPVNGMWPWAGLAMDSSNNLYGVTYAGGLGSQSICSGGCGAVFKFDSHGKLTVLHVFHGFDGENVQVSPTLDAVGNLYGVSSTGTGPAQNGTVFKVTAAGNFSVIHRFQGSDGAFPNGPLLIDHSGNLYGTTNRGGLYGYGNVFKMTPSGIETVLYDFMGGADGGTPGGNLLRDGQGNLYGTAAVGGAAFGNSGFGVIFKLTPAGTESVLYTFCATAGCMDGKYPESLVRVASGNFYGTTTEGGTANQGTVFGINSAGAEIMLYNFCSAGITSNCPDGSIPVGPILSLNGNLYGTTESGGLGTDYFSDPGVIFEMSPAGVETLLYSFPASYAMGGNSESGVIADSAGNLYGTFYTGGSTGGGGIFKLTKN